MHYGFRADCTHKACIPGGPVDGTQSSLNCSKPEHAIQSKIVQHPSFEVGALRALVQRFNPTFTITNRIVISPHIDAISYAAISPRREFRFSHKLQ